MVNLFPITLTIFGFLLLFFSGYYLLKQYLRTKILVILFVALGWFSLAAFILLSGTASLLSLDAVYIGSVYILFLTGFCVLFISDYFVYESYNPVKLALYAILCTIVVFMSFRSDSITPTVNMLGDEVIFAGGPYAHVTGILVFYFSLVFFSMNLRIYFHVPPQLHKPALINLIGTLIACIACPVIILLNLYLVIPGIDTLTLSIGFFLVAVEYRKHPELLFVLPFRAIRLDVIKNESGVSIYSHLWDNNRFIDEDLYSGMIQGMRGIINEAIRRGDIKEIILENAVILMRQNKNQSSLYVLVSTKSSKVLRSAFNKFVDAFEHKFSENIDTTNDISFFQNADEFIEQFLSFIPHY